MNSRTKRFEQRLSLTANVGPVGWPNCQFALASKTAADCFGSSPGTANYRVGQLVSLGLLVKENWGRYRKSDAQAPTPGFGIPTVNVRAPFILALPAEASAVTYEAIFSAIKEVFGSD